jgi:plasmid maintenance system antidote protein VapI
MLSEKFIAAIKLNPLKSYQIAHLAGLHPSTLSKIINGIERVFPNDPRVLKVAAVLGLTPEECFDHPS